MIHNARSLMSACVASRRALDPSRLRLNGAFFLNPSASGLREAQTRSSFADDLIGLLGGLVDEGLVDVGDHTTAGDGRLDEGVELLVTTDGELKVAGGDALDLEILGGVAGELENLGGEVLKDGSGVDGGGGADAAAGGSAVLEEAVDASDGELKARLDGAGGGLLLVASLHGALGTLAGEALTGEALSALARHVYVCVGGGTVSVA